MRRWRRGVTQSVEMYAAVVVRVKGIGAVDAARHEQKGDENRYGEHFLCLVQKNDFIKKNVMQPFLYIYSKTLNIHHSH